jgi:hypothetical protein
MCDKCSGERRRQQDYFFVSDELLPGLYQSYTTALTKTYQESLECLLKTGHTKAP